MRKVFTSIALLVSILCLGSPKLLPIRIDYQWGFANYEGQVVIEPQYDMVTKFDTAGTSKVRKGKHFGVIDTLNNEIIPIKYEEIRPLGNGCYKVKKTEGWSWFSPDKGCSPGAFDYIAPVKNNDNFYILKNNLKYGLFEVGHGQILKCEWDSIFLDSAYIGATHKKQITLHNKAGQRLHDTPCDDYHAFGLGMLAIRTKKGYGIINQEGVVLEPKWLTISYFGDSLLKFSTTKGFGMYSLIHEKIVVPAQFDDIQLVNDGYFIVHHKKRQGMIRPNGDEVLPCQYTDLQYLNRGLISYTNENNKAGIASMITGPIMQPQFDEVVPFTNVVTAVKSKDKAGLINDKGDLLISPSYDDISAKNNIYKLYAQDHVLWTKVSGDGQIETKRKLKALKTMKVSYRESIFSEALSPSFNFNTPTLITGSDDVIPESQQIKAFASADSSINFSIYDQRKERQTEYGIWDETKDKPFTKADFWFIHMEDFSEGTWARAVYSGGRNCFIHLSGRITFKAPTQESKSISDQPIVYISKFSKDGIATFNTGGVLNYKQKKNQKRIFYNLDQIKIDGGLWGYVNRDGEFLVPAKYHRSRRFINDRGIVRGNKGWGVIDARGDTIIDFNFDAISFLPGSNEEVFQVTKKRTRYGLSSAMGHELSNVEFKRVRPYSDNMAEVRQERKWNFIDRTGEVISLTGFQKVKRFNEGLAPVMLKNKWGYINKNGEIEIPCIYENAKPFTEGLAPVKFWGRYGFINAEGEFIIKAELANARPFNNGVAPAKKKGKWGLVNTKGHWVCRPHFYSIGQFDASGNARASKEYTSNGAEIPLTINRKGKIVSKNVYQYNLDSTATLFIAGVGKKGFQDKKGNWVIKPEYKELKPFSEGLAPAKKGRKWGLIDSTGQWMVQKEYSDISIFKGGLAIGEKGWRLETILPSGQSIPFENHSITWAQPAGHQLIMTRTRGTKQFEYQNIYGDNVFDKKFNKISPFVEGNAIVKSGKKYGVIDIQGNTVLPFNYDMIKRTTNGDLSLKCKQSFGLVDHTGYTIVDPNYEMVELFDDNIFTVRGGGKVGYIEANGIWVWEPSR